MNTIADVIQADHLFRVSCNDCKHDAGRIDLVTLAAKVGAERILAGPGRLCWRSSKRGSEREEIRVANWRVTGGFKV